MVSGTEVKELEEVKAEPMRSIPEVGLGYSDYTTERKELFKNLTKEDVAAGIKRMRDGKQ